MISFLTRTLANCNTTLLLLPRTNDADCNFIFVVLALVVVPVISVAVKKFGRYLRELSHKTQASAAIAASIAEVCWQNVFLFFLFFFVGV